MKNIITLCTLFLCLTALGVNITNYPLTNNYSGNELFLLSSIPWQTNFNLPGNYVAKTSDLNSASNSILAQMPTTNGFVDASVTNGLQGALINPLTNGHSAAVTISNVVTVSNSVPAGIALGVQNTNILTVSSNGVNVANIATNGCFYAGNGIQAAPGYAFSSSQNSGMYINPATSRLCLVQSGGVLLGFDGTYAYVNNGFDINGGGGLTLVSKMSDTALMVGRAAASPAAKYIIGSSGSGSDKPGANLTVSGGLPTGTGTPGSLYFGVGVSSNATGSILSYITNCAVLTPDRNFTFSNNVTAGGTLTATNGVKLMVKPGFTTNFTCTTNLQTYCCDGTNQLISLPDASSVPNVVYRFSTTNGWGSVIITNATGAQSIRDGTSLSYTNIGIGEFGVFSDGTCWRLASKGRTILPSASWSSATTITPAQDTITNIPWTDLEYNNSQGITLRTNATFVRPTELWVTNSGTYMITFSAVLKGASGGSVLSIWLRQNGTDVVRTRTDQGFSGTTAQQCMTVNYFVNVGAPSFFELCAASHDATPPTIVGATANPTGYTAPAMPAVIVTINRISDPWP